MTHCQQCDYPVSDPYHKHIPEGHASGAHEAVFCCLECYHLYLASLARYNREAYEADHNPTSPDALLELGPAD